MPKPGIIAACLICLVVGMVVGRLLPVESGGARDSGLSKGERSSRSPVKMPARSWANARPGSHDRSSRPAENPDDVTREENLVQVPYALLVELSRADGIRSIDHPLVSPDGRVEQILGITEREKAALQTAWQDSRSAIRAAEAAAVMMEELEDGAARLTLPDLTAQREAAARRCVSSVREVLGDNRGEIFLAVKQVQNAFATQGGNWSCIIAPESTGDGRWRFHMTVEDANGRRVWVGETVPDEIRHLADAVGVASSLNAGSPDP